MEGGVLIRKKTTMGRDIKAVAMAPFLDPRRKQATTGKA
jgi:hypothetical protein